MRDNSPDPVVATAAMTSNRILVTQDKDFNNQRFMQPRFATLSRLSLSCPASMMVERLKQEMEMIEFRWMRARRTGTPRMIVHVGRDQIRFRD
jgi:predicted nuclease of predicted toxin-antitoxin system